MIGGILASVEGAPAFADLGKLVDAAARRMNVVLRNVAFCARNLAVSKTHRYR